MCICVDHDHRGLQTKIACLVNYIIVDVKESLKSSSHYNSRCF